MDDLIGWYCHQIQACDTQAAALRAKVAGGADELRALAATKVAESLSWRIEKVQRHVAALTDELANLRAFSSQLRDQIKELIQ